MYKAIIFDFFDVIHHDSFQRWLKSMGIKRGGEWHQASVEMDKGQISVDEFIVRLSKLSGKSPETVKAELASHDGFDNDMLQFVKTVAEKHRVGLLSNGPKAFVRSLLKDGELEDVLHHIVISSEVGMVKPDPEIFHHILQKMNVDPDEAIFIDDNPKNVEAASKLGIYGVCYTDLPSLRMELARLGVKPA